MKPVIAVNRRDGRISRHYRSMRSAAINLSGRESLRKVIARRCNNGGQFINAPRVHIQQDWFVMYQADVQHLAQAHA